MLTYILFVIGFFVLIKGADLLVDGAESIAKKFNIPNIVIGLTIVAFGTSAPEFVVNIMASAKGNTDLAIGNIIGSNIANILLILGMSAVIYPLAAKKNTTWKEIPLSLLAAVVVGVMANDFLIDGASSSVLSRIDGIVLLLFFFIFISYTVGIARSSGERGTEEVSEFKTGRAIIYIILGLVGLTLGGNWIVEGAVKLAQLLNISETLIGLTIVAIGTSLPELATSVIAAYRKRADIAIGNVVGSNIFNIFFVLGFSAIIRPLPFNPAHNIDIGMAIAASLLLFLFMFFGKKQTLERWQGAFLIGLYVVYIIFSVIMNS